MKISFVGYNTNKVILFKYSNNKTLKDFFDSNIFRKQFPCFKYNVNLTGVNGEIVEPEYVLKNNDRIEVYEQLKINPKDARRLRSEAKRKKNNLQPFGA